MINRHTRNVSIILSPEPGYSLMQIRDDIPGRNVIQFFGGWFKGFYPEYTSPSDEESIGEAVYRELIEELGLALTEFWFFPFPTISDYSYKHKNKFDTIVYLTQANIKYNWIKNKEKIKPESEEMNYLALREGSKMDVYKLDDKLLNFDLYDNDRKMLNIYLKNKSEIEQSAFKITIDKSLSKRLPKDVIEKITIQT